MKAMKSEELYIPFVTAHGPFDDVITNSPKRVPNNFSFSLSPLHYVCHLDTLNTTKQWRQPAEWGSRRQQHSTATLTTWDGDNDEWSSRPHLVCIFFVFLNSFYFTNVSLHVQPSLPPLPPPYYPTSRQQRTRLIQHHTKWRRWVGPLPACHLDARDADAISSLRYNFFLIFFFFFFVLTINI